MAAEDTVSPDSTLSSPYQRRNKVALFVDAENVLSALKRDAGKLIDLVREEGSLVFAKAYGDWSNNALKGMMRGLQDVGFQLEQLATDSRGKNTADMQLALDALEMAMQPDAPETVIIVSSDRDYVPLVLKLRRRSVRVVGAGVAGIISPYLRTVCDRFVEFTPESKAAESALPSQVAPSAAGKFAILLRAVADCIDRGAERPPMASVAYRVKELDTAFNYKAMGYAKFIDYVREAETQGMVKIESAGVDQFVTLGGTATPPASAKNDYSTSDAARATYTRLLKAKKVDLIPFVDRQHLCEALYEYVQEYDEGVTLQQMNLFVWARAQMLSSAPEYSACLKLVQSLNVAKCFEGDAGVQYVTDMENELLVFVISKAEIIEYLHSAYVGAVLLGDKSAVVRPELVAEWLIGDTEPSSVQSAASSIERARENLAGQLAKRTSG